MDIQVDAKEVLGTFRSLSRQAPYAISVAVNNLMKHGQSIVQGSLDHEFTLRGSSRASFIKRTVKVREWAKKTKLTAEIGIDPSRNLLAKFEDGGLKRPTSGRSLAVPIAVRRSSTGVVIKSMRVRELQLRAHRTAKGRVQLKGLKRTFTVKGPGGGAILQRVGRRPKGGATLAEEIARGTIRVAYAFKRSVPIPANLKFMDTFQADAVSWSRFMEEAWDQAQRTAR